MSLLSSSLANACSVGAEFVSEMFRSAGSMYSSRTLEALMRRQSFDPAGPFAILVVEDDRRIRNEVSELLSASGFGVRTASSLREAELALEREFDLILLDLGLPDGDGLDLCHSLRRNRVETPIVVLTARDAPSQRVRGLDLGADDYVTKPFHPPELVARIRSVLRRANRDQPEGRACVGELWADPESRTAGRANELFQLPPREFELYYFLLQNPGRAWTRDQLIEQTWGEEFDGDPRTIDLYVRRLRTQIEQDASDPRWLQTVWGVGYRLNDAS